jgi:sodium transport system permease protein
MYAVPLVSQQVVITRLIRGEFVGGTAIALCLAGTAVMAVVVYCVTARIYQGERLAIST